MLELTGVVQMGFHLERVCACRHLPNGIIIGTDVLKPNILNVDIESTDKAELAESKFLTSNNNLSAYSITL